MKKLLFVIALICLILLAVFLFIRLGDNQNETDDITASPSAGATDTVTDEPSASPGITENTSPTESSAQGAVVSGNVSGGTDDGAYSITVNENDYTYMNENGSDRFYDNSNIDEVVFLEVRYIDGTTAETLAPSFLNSYIVFTDIEYSGVNEIEQTGIYGETISAKNDMMEMNAWLVDTENGVLAIVVSYTLENKDEQMTKLYAMLDTLEINQNS